MRRTLEASPIAPALSPANWLLVLGVLLTSAPQLRLPGLPFGPGEGLLAVWMIATLAGFAFRGKGVREESSGAFWVVFAFWLLSIVLLGLGLFTSHVFGRVEDSGSARDSVAIAFAATFSVFFAASRRGDGLIARIAVQFAQSASVLFGGILILALLVPSIGPMEFWYQSVRFVALTTNPNQLALFVAVAPLFVLQCVADQRRSATLRERFCILVLFIVGIATTSDALLAAWLSGFGLVALGWWLSSLVGTSRSRVSVFTSVAAIPASVLLVLIFFGQTITEKFETKVLAVIELGSQASVRLTLWSSGLRALAASPLIGWGPGAHSGMHGPFEGTEAHNTYVDWAASSGLLGLTLLFGVLSYALLVSIRSRRKYLAVAVLVLMVFCMFHYVLRQPVFWFALLTVLFWATKRSAQAPGRS